MKNQRKAIVLAFCVVLCWSTVATSFKIALEGTNFLGLLIVCNAVALIFSLFILLFSEERKKIKNNILSTNFLGKCAIAGLLNPFVYYLILFKSYELLPAQIAQPLNYSWQIVLIIFLAIFFKERLSFKKIIGIIVSFLGVIWLSIFSQSSGIFGNISILGIILALFSAFVWAGYWILKMKSNDSVNLSMFFNFLFSFIYIVIFSFFIEFHLPVGKYLLASIYAGIMEMAIPFFLWNRALSLAVNRSSITQITYLSPFLSLIFINYILGERVSYFSLIGLILIIAGIVIINVKLKRVH